MYRGLSHAQIGLSARRHEATRRRRAPTTAAAAEMGERWVGGGRVGDGDAATRWLAVTGDKRMRLCAALPGGRGGGTSQTEQLQPQPPQACHSSYIVTASELRVSRHQNYHRLVPIEPSSPVHLRLHLRANLPNRTAEHARRELHPWTEFQLPIQLQSSSSPAPLPAALPSQVGQSSRLFPRVAGHLDAGCLLNAGRRALDAEGWQLATGNWPLASMRPSADCPKSPYLDKRAADDARK